jgi:hypothetical protein
MRAMYGGTIHRHPLTDGFEALNAFGRESTQRCGTDIEQKIAAFGSNICYIPD